MVSTLANPRASRIDGIQVHCPDSIHCDQCSTRHVGKHKHKQYFHTMLSATVVANGHNRVLPVMPKFVQPQNDPAAGQPDLTGQQLKQDYERNAAIGWLDPNAIMHSTAQPTDLLSPLSPTPHLPLLCGLLLDRWILLI